MEKAVLLKNFWFRATTGWLGLLVMAYANGALRELVVKKLMHMDDSLAHQLSCLTGVILWTSLTVLMWSKLQVYSFKKSLQLGDGWFLATGLFETFVLNRNLSWGEILNTYNFMNGEFWGLALSWIGLMPGLIYLYKKKRI